MDAREQALDQLFALAEHQIRQQREVSFRACYQWQAKPLSGNRLLVYTGRRDGPEAPLHLERRLDRCGCCEDIVRYGESYLEFSLETGALEEQVRFSEVSLQLFRPGRWLEQVSFALDLNDFFVSPLDRGSQEQHEVLFNMRHDFAVRGLTVRCEKNPPIVVVPRRAENIAYFEKYDMGRYVLGINARQYLAAWNSFFPHPKKKGDVLVAEFAVSTKPPRGFLKELASSKKDPPFQYQPGRGSSLRSPDEEPPSTEPYLNVVFYFRDSFILHPEMFA